MSNNTLDDINCALVQALGIDPKGCVAVTLRVRANALPVVVVHRYIGFDNPPEAGRLREVVQRFELRPEVE